MRKIKFIGLLIVISMFLTGCGNESNNLNEDLSNEIPDKTISCKGNYSFENEELEYNILFNFKNDYVYDANFLLKAKITNDDFYYETADIFEDDFCNNEYMYADSCEAKYIDETEVDVSAYRKFKGNEDWLFTFNWDFTEHKTYDDLIKYLNEDDENMDNEDLLYIDMNCE